MIIKQVVLEGLVVDGGFDLIEGLFGEAAGLEFTVKFRVDVSHVRNIHGLHGECKVFLQNPLG